MDVLPFFPSFCASPPILFYVKRICLAINDEAGADHLLIVHLPMMFLGYILYLMGLILIKAG